MLTVVLIVFAFVFACIAAVVREPVEPHRTRLIAAALAFYFAASIFGSESVRKAFGQQTPMAPEVQKAFWTGQ